MKCSRHISGERCDISVKTWHPSRNHFRVTMHCTYGITWTRIFLAHLRPALSHAANWQSAGAWCPAYSASPHHQSPRPPLCASQYTDAELRHTFHYGLLCSTRCGFTRRNSILIVEMRWRERASSYCAIVTWTPTRTLTSTVHTNTDAYKHCYFPRTIRHWNRLFQCSFTPQQDTFLKHTHLSTQHNTSSSGLVESIQGSS